MNRREMIQVFLLAFCFTLVLFASYYWISPSIFSHLRNSVFCGADMNVFNNRVQDIADCFGKPHMPPLFFFMLFFVGQIFSLKFMKQNFFSAQLQISLSALSKRKLTSLIVFTFATIVLIFIAWYGTAWYELVQFLKK